MYLCIHVTCLFESKDGIHLSTEPSFTWCRKMTLIYLVPDCKCVTLPSYMDDCKTGFGTKILDPSSVA